MVVVELDEAWGAVGRCGAGEFDGHHVWVFVWRSADGEPLAWEVRVCAIGAAENSAIDKWEHLFRDIGDLEQFAAAHKVRWLPRDEGIAVVQRCFPWEAQRIRTGGK